MMELACVSLLRSALFSPLLLTITVDLGAKGLRRCHLSPDCPLAVRGGKSEGNLFLVHETNVHTCVSYVVPPTLSLLPPSLPAVPAHRGPSSVSGLSEGGTSVEGSSNLAQHHNHNSGQGIGKPQA